MLSDPFFIVNYSLAIVFSIVGLSLCLLTIVITITHRQCHNFTNVLSCNTCTAVTLYFIFRILTCIYGLRQDWQFHQPACIFRAYCSLALCAALCYSYSIQATSRLFFAVFYKHKYLLTWRTHWIMIIVNWIISFIISIQPFFYQHGFELEIESRSCVVTPKIVSISMYTLVIIFIIPLIVVTIFGGIIVYYVRQSSRRIAAVVSNVAENASTVQVSKRYGKQRTELIKDKTQTFTGNFRNLSARHGRQIFKDFP
ncbi:unnamed protein product [Rotaria sordida]|uniref:G-protein coupled receptors family 1 profile domain-containing protein n=1 Tax=Rotaria sordida TaxID=392033 RepID=A0A818ZBS8_9BILA|nr:unnamed protein product [Rotaria sordida]CAF0892739.1 unnamed protein product [Rotaria sordida]CAF0953710.1 unnamed protein product [Rotaria sordida]CAF3766574.1 unnamed protein product [Rotaria sordida]